MRKHLGGYTEQELAIIKAGQASLLAAISMPEDHVYRSANLESCWNRKFFHTDPRVQSKRGYIRLGISDKQILRKYYRPSGANFRGNNHLFGTGGDNENI